MSTLTYLKSFIKDKKVASVTPSSKFCVKRVCKKIDFDRKNIIVEYGPGTGVYSRYLLERLTPESELILIETNDKFVEKLREMNDPRVTVHQESVEHLRALLGESYRGKVNYIISGIPFSFLEEGVKMNILDVSRQFLAPDGKFLAYQTSGHLKEPLRETFGNLRTEMEWLNIPPMMIYEAVKGE